MALTFLQRKPDSGLGNIRSSPGSPSRNIDWVLMFTQATLSAAGLFVVYSASQAKYPDNPFIYVTRQEVFLIAAVLAMVAVMSVDYELWRERSRFLYGATIIFLVLVILLGTVSGGARLSFDIGPLNLQPAEAAKFTILLALSAYLSEDDSDQIPYHRFVAGLLMVGGPAALVIVQPDLGSASVLIAMVMGAMLVAGAKPKYIAMITFLTAVTVAAAIVSGIVNDYQLQRLTVFFDQNTTDPQLRDVVFQGRNAINAVATGGIKGKGWLQGPITNTKDIPVQWADFPFSAVAEQFGLVGGGVLIGLFGIMLFRIWRIAQLSKDLFGTYICVCVFTMLLWQVFQNVAMTVGIMPITGLPLPLISYGGSSLVAYFAMLGLVQSVHMRRYR